MKKEVTIKKGEKQEFHEVCLGTKRWEGYLLAGDNGRMFHFLLKT